MLHDVFVALSSCASAYFSPACLNTSFMVGTKRCPLLCINSFENEAVYVYMPFPTFTYS